MQLTLYIQYIYIYIYIYIYNIQIYTNAEIKLSRKNHNPDEVNDNFYYVALDCSRYNARSDRLRARYTAIMPTGHLRFMQITRTRNLAKNVNWPRRSFRFLKIRAHERPINSQSLNNLDWIRDSVVQFNDCVVNEWIGKLAAWSQINGCQLPITSKNKRFSKNKTRII